MSPVTANAARPYPEVPTKADYPAIERRILNTWDRDGTFQASIDNRADDPNPFNFNDGPPFANGLPHYGHLLTGYVKDVVPRYQTMLGRRVERDFGWDCHGLPVEMQVEKELGVSGRAQITDYGIGNFNDACSTSVMRHASEWETYVTRQARWVDFTNDYKTMDQPYMESVMWAFKQLWEKGLIYEAFRVMPYSWGAETPLSNFEIRLDDATRPRQDPAVTVGFELVPDAAATALLGGATPTKVLAWTTTPWTLPSNLALAVGPDLDYAVVELDGVRYVLEDGRRDYYAPQLGEAEVLGTVKGSDLVGRSYTPLLPYFADNPNSFVVLGADWVETGDGTGVVHLAPGFGEDDQTVCEAVGIPLVVPVDEKGQFTAEVPDWAGVNVFEANPLVIKRLKETGQLVRQDSYTHNYPHCWRTDTPIIYRAQSSWYVKVTEFRDRMVELNQEINWIPGHIRDGAFGKWLEGARDWSISRNRFWGAAIPVWRSDNPAYPRVDAYGSIDELEADFGVRPDNLHRPFIDDLVRPNPDDPTGESMMRRVPEVLDCWFESGSMPYAQHHYPFNLTTEGENGFGADPEDFFRESIHADFIVEYIAQTRGWFYTMHVLSTALFDQPAFSNVICHGTVGDAEGKKLSKKLRNYPDPEEMFDSHGSDALRWYLMSSAILRGGDLRVSLDGSEVNDAVRLVLNPIWNAWHFFALYANADGYSAKLVEPGAAEDLALLDRYILAKTAELVDQVGDCMDGYDIPGACAAVTPFLDALTNWYIRRSRDRFWAPANSGDPATDASKHAAYDTLYTVLHVLSRLVAPLLPFVAEEVYTGLVGSAASGSDGGSVHLTDYPTVDELIADPDLVADMDRVRHASTAALSLREERRLRTRLPLARLTVAGATTDRLEALAGLLADEVNVKEVVFEDDLSAYGSFVLKPNGKVLGPKLGKDFKAVMGAAKSGDWVDEGDGTVTVVGQTLGDGDFELTLATEEGEATAALPGNRTIVNLDVEVTPELAAEGMARDMIRHVQQARKDADFVVTDRIALVIAAEDDLLAAFEAHQATIADAVLATSLSFGPVGGDAVNVEVEGQPVTFSVVVV